MTHTVSFPGLMARQTGFLAFVLGLLAYAYPLPAGVCLILLWFALLCLGGERPPIWAFALFFLLGAGYVALRVPDPPPPVPEFITSRTKVEMHGIIDRVDLRAGKRARVILRDVRCSLPDGSEERLDGRTVVNWDYPPRIPVAGDRISARVRIKPTRNFGNPGAWDFEWYWRCRDVYYRSYLRGADKHAELSADPPGFWERLRARISDPVLSRLPDTDGGGILAALVLGDRFRMSLDAEAAVRSAGLAHTLALSGLHVGFVAGAGVGIAWSAGFMWPGLLLLVPRPKLAVLTAAPLVLAYMWIGGFTPSLIRAGLMFGAWGVLLLMNRENVLPDGLFWAVGIILLVSPLSVYDLSLQLSALAVAGIAVVLPLVRRYRLPAGTGGRWWKTPVNGAAGLVFVSLGATLGIVPLMAMYFGEVSPNLLINVVWLPLLGLVVMPLGLAGSALCAWPWTAGFGGLLLHGAAGVLDWMLHGLARLDGLGLVPHYAVMRPDWVQAAGYGVLSSGVACLLYGSKRRATIPVVALGVAMLVAPAIVRGMEPNRVELSMIDVGQGQSVLVTSPVGKRLLIDGGGPGSRRFDIGKSVVAPVLAQSRMPTVDAVMLTHPDADHYKGLVYILRQFDVDVFYHNGRRKDGRGWIELGRAVNAGGVESRVLTAGDVLDLGGGLKVEVLHPPAGYAPDSSNDASLVVFLSWRGRGLALIAGDIEREGLDVLLGREMGSVDVLVVPHHGSKGSLNSEFYTRLEAKYAFISAGCLNHFHFPHPAVVRGLEKAGMDVHVTGDEGMLTAAWAFPEHGPEISVGPESELFGVLPSKP